MPTLAFLMLALLSLAFGVLVEPRASKAETATKLDGPSRESKVGPGFRIVSEDLSPATSTRYAAVTIARRIAEAEIARIADQVRAREKMPFEKTVVNFYLPGMKVGTGAWATATFQPTLKIAIKGLRLEDAQLAIAEAAADRREVVGVWLTSSPAPLGWVTIYREGGKTFSEWRLGDGTRSSEEVTVSQDRHGRKLTPTAGSSEFFLIGHDGSLELRDGSGVIATGERLPPSTEGKPGGVAEAKVEAKTEARPAKSQRSASRSKVAKSKAGTAEASLAFTSQLRNF